MVAPRGAIRLHDTKSGEKVENAGEKEGAREVLAWYICGASLPLEISADHIDAAGHGVYPCNQLAKVVIGERFDDGDDIDDG